MNPVNGMVNCSDVGTCILTCNTGFTLNGSAVRNCQKDGMWSGTQPTCSQGMCIKKILDPKFIVFQCNKVPSLP